MTRELRFYADSAVVEDVSDVLTNRLVRGVTTNPTILERAHLSVQDIPQLYTRWQAEGAQEIFFQAWGKNAKAMTENGRDLAALGSRVVVKVPATRDGFTAAAALVDAGTSVLVTAVYAQSQALAAATVGARYIAPYLGRLNDAGRDGVAEIAAMQALLAGTGTSVLAASLRTPEDIVSLAMVGVAFFTAGPSVILAAFNNDVSERSAEEFEEAVARGLAD